MSSGNKNFLQWIEIDRAALVHNAGQFRSLLGPDQKLMAVVKANAYGHGLLDVSKIVLGAGADWLGVNSVEEGAALRQAGISAPVLVLGPVLLRDLERALRHDLRLTVYNVATIEALGRLALRLKVKARIHLKIETGTYRQGVRPEDVVPFVRRIRRLRGLCLEGLSSHFANIEDTTSSSYPQLQLNAFGSAADRLGRDKFAIPFRHMSCTASSILYPATHFNMVRVGIGLYGLWPSKETLLSCRLQNREPVELRPVLAWRARIVQLKSVPKGAFIGYGGTYRSTRAMRLAVIPVGYSDGYDRGLSNSAHVLIRGHRAAVRGRVAMNFTVADVTDIPRVRLEDEATLIGKSGKETVTAEFLASLAGTIAYEILARLNAHIPRIVV